MSDLHPDIPNLDDGFTARELRELGPVYKLLSEYCHLKSRAMFYREKGSIQRAMLDENKCRELHDKLPEWAKW